MGTGRISRVLSECDYPHLYPAPFYCEERLCSKKVRGLVAISLDSDVTVGTQAAYPRLLTRRTNAHLLFCLTPRGVFLAGYIAIAYGSLLHYLFTFTPTPIDYSLI